jgi:hypothetical protein
MHQFIFWCLAIESLHLEDNQWGQSHDFCVCSLFTHALSADSENWARHSWLSLSFRLSLSFLMPSFSPQSISRPFKMSALLVRVSLIAIEWILIRNYSVIIWNVVYWRRHSIMPPSSGMKCPRDVMTLWNVSGNWILRGQSLRKTDVSFVEAAINDGPRMECLSTLNLWTFTLDICFVER